jgi:hypothetical protein
LNVFGLEFGPVVSPYKHGNETHKRQNPQVAENYSLLKKVCATWGW